MGDYFEEENKDPEEEHAEEPEKIIEDMKTSELLDKLHVEIKEKVVISGWDNADKIARELYSREPFDYLKTEIEGGEDEPGFQEDIERLEEEIKKLKEMIRKHGHIDGNVMVKW